MKKGNHKYLPEKEKSLGYSKCFIGNLKDSWTRYFYCRVKFKLFGFNGRRFVWRKEKKSG